MWRGTTLRSLIEVLDRVIGRGVVIDSGVPVSPALAGLRAAQAREDSQATPLDAEAEPERAPDAEAEAPRDDRRDPPSRRAPLR